MPNETGKGSGTWPPGACLWLQDRTSGPHRDTPTATIWLFGDPELGAGADLVILKIILERDLLRGVAKRAQV